MVRTSGSFIQRDDNASLSSTQGMSVSVEFVNNLQTQVADELLRLIQSEHANSAEKIRSAQRKVDDAHAKANSIEQAFLSVAQGVLSAEADMERGTAVIGQYIVKGVLKDV